MTNVIYARSEIDQQSKAWTATWLVLPKKTLAEALEEAGKQTWLVTVRIHALCLFERRGSSAPPGPGRLGHATTGCLRCCRTGVSAPGGNGLFAGPPHSPLRVQRVFSDVRGRLYLRP